MKLFPYDKFIRNTNIVKCVHIIKALRYSEILSLENFYQVTLPQIIYKSADFP
jgi:hypothetical protein